MREKPIQSRGAPSVLAVVIIVVLSLFALLASVSTLPLGVTASAPPVDCSTTSAPNATVKIVDFAFTPKNIVVVIGVNNTVQWSNTGSVSHTVTSNTGAFDSGALSPGDTFVCTFNATGSFAYHCSFHPSIMNAKVVVMGGGESTTTGTSTASSSTTSSTTTRSVVTLGAPPAKLPKGVIAFVPVLLTNSQPVQTATGFDQMVVVNSSEFAPFEGRNLQNVEFFTRSGTIVPSWLESGASNSSVSSVYWLKVPGHIVAGGSLLMFMGFATPSASFFNGKTVGEAPQLSAKYGQFDDGRLVFQLYDNFRKGESASLWTKNLTGGGSFSISNSLTVSFGSNPGFFANHKTFGAGTDFDALVIKSGPGGATGYLSTKHSLRNSGNGRPDWGGAFIRSDCGSTFPDQLNGTADANPCGSIDGNLSASGSVSGVFSVNPLSTKSSLQSINYSEGRASEPIRSASPSYPASPGFTGQGGSTSAQWVRVRTAPPNGVMPAVAFGSPQAFVNIAKGASDSANPLFFTPSSIKVIQGTTVTWINDDGATHTVTADHGDFDSGFLSHGAKFSFTFQQTGNFPYHCSIHSWMSGNVQVAP